jgi:methenyltetrahydrofolate cyclohydrolase
VLDPLDPHRVLEALADIDRAAAGGSAAALTAAMAAAVTSKAASRSLLPAAAAQADALRSRLVVYARDDADALTAARFALQDVALREPELVGDERRDFQLGRMLNRAAAVPAAIAESAADVAVLAATFHERCDHDLQPDLVVAAMLAAAAARAAAHLVEINLGTTPDDDSAVTANAAAAAAATAVAAISSPAT